jgi:glycosyltransferase involved in cell wall biosynthesis
MLAYTYYEGDNRVRRYAEALAKRGDTVDVVLCGQKGQLSHAVIAGVNVFRTQVRRINEKTNVDYLIKIMLFLFQSFVVLTWRHLRNPYKIIHVHSVPDFEVFAAVAAKLTGAKVILDIHDIVPEFYAGKFSKGRITVLSEALMAVEKICCAFSDHVIIANHLWWDKIVTRSVKKEKCTVILNYPDPAVFNSTLPHHSGGTFTMSYPGSLSHHQGLDIAIHALSLVKAESPLPFQFNLYGRGSNVAALKELTLSLGLEDRVLFHGILPIDEIAKKMAMSDLGIVPKRADDFGNEAFSTKIFEFMALGVPVLISSTKVDRYYFNDSIVMFFESGNVRELADKILYLANNKPVRDMLVKNARPFIKNYSWEVKKSEYFALIDSLTSKKRREPWQKTPSVMPLSHRQRTKNATSLKPSSP